MRSMATRTTESSSSADLPLQGSGRAASAAGISGRSSPPPYAGDYSARSLRGSKSRRSRAFASKDDDRARTKLRSQGAYERELPEELSERHYLSAEDSYERRKLLEVAPRLLARARAQNQHIQQLIAECFREDEDFLNSVHLFALLVCGTVGQAHTKFWIDSGENGFSTLLKYTHRKLLTKLTHEIRLTTARTDTVLLNADELSIDSEALRHHLTMYIRQERKLSASEQRRQQHQLLFSDREEGLSDDRRDSPLASSRFGDENEVGFETEEIGSGIGDDAEETSIIYSQPEQSPNKVSVDSSKQHRSRPGLTLRLANTQQSSSSAATLTGVSPKLLLDKGKESSEFIESPVQKLTPSTTTKPISNTTRVALNACNSALNVLSQGSAEFCFRASTDLLGAMRDSHWPSAVQCTDESVSEYDEDADLACTIHALMMQHGIEFCTRPLNGDMSMALTPVSIATSLDIDRREIFLTLLRSGDLLEGQLIALRRQAHPSQALAQFLETPDSITLRPVAHPTLTASGASTDFFYDSNVQRRRLLNRLVTEGFLNAIDTAHSLIGGHPSLSALVERDGALRSAFARLTASHYTLNSTLTSVYASSARVRQARETAAAALAHMRRALGEFSDSGDWCSRETISPLDTVSRLNSGAVAMYDRYFTSAFEKERRGALQYERKRALTSEWYNVFIP